MSILPSHGIGVLAIAVILATAVVMPPQAVAVPTLEELGNIAYSGIYEEPVQLVNGVYEGEPFVPGGAARQRVELLADLHATADIDGDGSEEAFVLLSESSSGTGQFLYLAAVTQAEGSARNLGTVSVGDRVDVIGLTSANGEATLEYIVAGPGEPACCPTLMISSTYGFRDGRLVEVSRKELGMLSVGQLAGPTWRLTAFGWNETIPQGVSITATFEGNRISGSAGCNNYFATLDAPTPYELSIGPVGATRMACPPLQMEAEDRFLTALGTATQFGFLLGKLVISYQQDNTQAVLIFERSAGG
jgi:heat shock protein HslJ